MWYEDDYQDYTDDVGSRRRRRKRLVCECVEVRDERDRDRDCGCGRSRERHCGCCDVRDEHDHDCRCGDVEGERDHGHCTGCVCNQLKNLAMGTTIDITTTGLNNFATVTFRRFDRKTCCATFMQGAAEIIVDCKNILAVRFP